MNKETLFEKEITLGYLTAMIAKSMYLLSASDKMEFAMIFISSAKGDMDEAEQEARSWAKPWAISVRWWPSYIAAETVRSPGSSIPTQALRIVP